VEIAIIAAIALIAVGVVVMPLLRKSNPSAGVQLSDESIDQQVALYRAALKSNTLCERCLAANPAGSRFCGECGREL
jgi:hypothetical protein